MVVRNIKIVGSGQYLPRTVVSGEELEKKHGFAPGSTEKASGVKNRRYAQPDETASKMGAAAIKAALKNAGLTYEDLDAIVCGSGTQEQPIPSTAALVQRALGQERSGTPCFDVNSTCLSFVTALDLVSCLIQTGRFHRVAIVSTEIASVGLSWNHIEAGSLFGDGAAAVIVERASVGDSSKLLSSGMETYSLGAATCEIVGGGTGLHAKHISHPEDDRFLFRMDGRKAFRLASEVLPALVRKMLVDARLSLHDLKLVVPHQASASALELIRRKMDLPEERWMTILSDHGNMIAAAIPAALHIAIEQKRIVRGDKFMLLGTSAGFSVGGAILEY